MSINSAALVFATSVLAGSLNFHQLHAAWQSPPEQFTNSGQGFTPDVATNDEGDAIAVWVDNGVVEASFFSDGDWGTITTVSTNTGTNFSSKVAFDNSGTGVAIWATTAATNSVHASVFKDGVWTEQPISPLDSSTNVFQSPAVAMNGSGGALATWIELTVNEVRSSRFTSFWNSATTIGTGDGTVSVAYAAQKGVAAWTNGGVVTVNQFISNAWQTATPIGEIGDTSPSVGIDTNGNAIAIWLLTPTGTVMSSRFNGTSWSAGQAISTGTGNKNPSLGMAPGGTAVALWIDSASQVQSNSFDGTSWGTPILVAAAPLAKQADVSVASNGNALALWAGLSTNDITSAGLRLGSTTWSSQETVGTFSNPPDQVVAAFSSSNRGFGVWIEDEPGNAQDVFGSFTPAVLSPLPPAAIEGKVRINNFASQYDRLHIINFAPSTDSTTTFYRLRRNGMLIADIPKIGPFNYVDHGRSKNKKDRYSLVSVNEGDLESEPLSISLK